MADSAPAKSPAKKRVAKPKKPASHPKYSDMIKKAVAALAERGGSSRQAIQKYILKNFKVNEANCGTHLKMALRAGVKNKTLKQSKGTGASGSFKLGDKTEKTKKPKAKKVKKPKAAGAKKVRKPKTAAKKSPKKAKKPKAAKKSPKKAAKPKAAKKAPAKKAAKPKKTKSPKKKAAAKK